MRPFCFLALRIYLEDSSKSVFTSDHTSSFCYLWPVNHAFTPQQIYWFRWTFDPASLGLYSVFLKLLEVTFGSDEKRYLGMHRVNLLHPNHPGSFDCRKNRKISHPRGLSHCSEYFGPTRWLSKSLNVRWKFKWGKSLFSFLREPTTRAPHRTFVFSRAQTFCNDHSRYLAVLVVFLSFMLQHQEEIDCRHGA